jgi:putative hemolysin
MVGIRLIGILALVAVNGFFAAAEFSLVAVRASRIRQLVERGSRRARIVQDLLAELNRVVSGVQVGVTLASLGLGALGEPVLAELFRPMLSWLPSGRAAILAHGLAVTLAFALLTVLHVVLGELVPKTISLERAGRVSLLIARPFSWYLRVFRWAIALLEGLSRRVVRVLGIKPPAAGHTLPHSAEELQIQIREAREHGLVAPGEESFIQGAIELGQIRVREIMVPRPDVRALSVDADLEETLNLFSSTRRSRLPVYESSLDHVLGFVHVKDVLALLLDHRRSSEQGAPLQPFHLHDLTRELLIVPESKLASELLIEMRARRITMAMAVDEFGSILGLVTMEDLLEQMVGEIHDEFDIVGGPQIVRTGSEDAMVFSGGIGVRDLDVQYKIALPEDAAYSTLGGFVLAQLGAIPKGGESFDYGGYRFSVLEMERHRVARVKLQRLSSASGSRIPAPRETPSVAPGSAGGEDRAARPALASRERPVAPVKNRE